MPRQVRVTAALARCNVGNVSAIVVNTPSAIASIARSIYSPLRNDIMKWLALPNAPRKNRQSKFAIASSDHFGGRQANARRAACPFSAQKPGMATHVGTACAVRQGDPNS
jgi:hypothetical protein